MPSSRRSRRARSSGVLLAALAWGRVAVELRQDELADVVQERGHSELVALRQLRHFTDPLGGDAHGDSVSTEALIAIRDEARGAEHVVGIDRLGERAHRVHLQRLDRLAHAPVRPEGPAPLLAARMTVIARAASASIASASSFDELAWRSHRPRRRRRASERAGIRDTSSKASARRLPPTPPRRSGAVVFVA